MTAKKASERIIVLRHADAIARNRFNGPDTERPLTKRGWAQAVKLAREITDALPYVLCSPARRCIETVEPLAKERQLAVEVVDFLNEGSDPEEALARLVERASPEGALVACTHGDLLDGFVEMLSSGDISGAARLSSVQKGGALELEVVGSRVRAAAVQPAP